jgi:hypothetical protein
MFACGGCPKSMEAPGGGGHGGLAKWDSLPYHIVIEERALRPVDDPAELMARIVPLRDTIEAEASCTGAAIADGVVLTAAHCLAPGRARYAGTAMMKDGELSRACRGGTCADRPTGGTSEWEFRRDDIGAVMMSDPLSPPMPLDLLDIPGGGDLPPIYLASAQRSGPLLACKVSIVFGEGTGSGAIVEGDSGSPLFVVEPDRAPSIVGVVSGRSEVAGRWYFAPVEPLPWPALADLLAKPEVQRRSVELVDPRCSP